MTPLFEFTITLFGLLLSITCTVEPNPTDPMGANLPQPYYCAIDGPTFVIFAEGYYYTVPKKLNPDDGKGM